jgi:hypothetical protein
VNRRLATVLLSCCALTAQQPAAAAPQLHPDVALLLARETRQSAMERILERGEHRGDGTYEEGVRPFRVGHVVVCPQERGMPMMAVFGQMGWRVDPCGDGEPAWIRIGPKDPKTGDLKEVVAEWRWYGDRKSWVGPGGGPDQPFVRLPPVGSAGLEEFLAAQRRVRDR